uniref:Protein HIRA n=1 Tax=Ciona savignyi TaxID=51511 RepID=H2YBG8_CIOSA
MKLFKPPWVTHDEKPVFSIDIHPDESRFATGGQGDGGSSGKVIIWNMTPVVNEKEEAKENVPKVLCVMDNHLACVNCVRWSCNGRYLASGGDDRLIMIWQFAGLIRVCLGVNPPFKTAIGERWRCSHTLKGHTGDVLDLAWSPGDQWLASCSIDNTVVVWDVQKFPAITTVLKGHSSLVKGVTWDPVGSYLASQSDDKTVKVWKTLDWKLEATVSKPFEECSATTHVLRLSWSPDGGILVSAHAMNNSGPTAQIIDRDGWRTDMDFVGHRKAITCTRFNSRMFSKSKTGEDFKPYTCCAVGSRDRSLSVWLTSLRRPLVVVHDLFDDSLMDISWSYSGYSMLCCSWDGTVAYVRFTAEELGQTISQEEKNKLHKETYGKTSTMVSQPLIIENPAMLAIQQKKNDVNPSSDQNEPPKAPTTPIKYPVCGNVQIKYLTDYGNTKQIETRTPSGKRRIIPVFVAPQEALGGIPTPFGSSSPFGKSNSSSNLSKSFDKLSDNSGSGSPLKVVRLFSRMSSFLIPLYNIEKTKISPQQIAPDKITTPAKPSEANTNTTQVNGMQHSGEFKLLYLSTVLAHVGTRSINYDKFAPSPEAPSPILPRRPGRPPLHLKRKQGALPASPGRKKHKIAKDVAKIVEESPVRHEQSNKEVEDEIIAIRQSTKPLHPPDTQPSVMYCMVQVNNELNSEDKAIPSALHKITCCVDKHEVWSAVLSSPVVAMSLSRHIVGAGCADHSITVLSAKSGRQILPQICFGSHSSPLAVLQCRSHHMMAVDTACHLSVWDTQSGTVVIDNKSFSNQIYSSHGSKSTTGSENPTLQKCSLTDRGLPLITLSNAKIFTYNTNMGSWTYVSQPGDPIEQFTENISTMDGDASGDGEIAGLLKKKFNHGMGSLAARTFHTTASTQRDATLAMLERKLSASLLLECASQYKRWLLAYIRYVVQENYDLRLREVCDDLIGPPANRATSDALYSMETLCLGETLLREEVLPVIGANLSFQRMYTEYQDQLDIAGDS